MNELHEAGFICVNKITDIGVISGKLRKSLIPLLKKHIFVETIRVDELIKMV